MGLLTIHRTDTDAVICSETRDSNPSATWGGSFVGNRTFTCKDKIMPINLVIGGKTLNCKDKVLPYNIRAYYRFGWKKYNSYYEYSMSEQTVSEGLNAYTTGMRSWLCPVITDYTFDTSTGLFTVSGVSYYDIDDETSHNVNRPYYTSEPISPGERITTVSSLVRADEGATLLAHNIINSGCVEARNGSATKITSSGSWYKGTFVADVEATNENEYPSNGRHTDGFWYVRQY